MNPLMMNSNITRGIVGLSSFGISAHGVSYKHKENNSCSITYKRSFDRSHAKIRRFSWRQPFRTLRGFVVLLFLAFADLSTKLLHISFSLMISLPLPWHISYFLIITEDAKQEVDSDSSTCVFQSRV